MLTPAGHTIENKLFGMLNVESCRRLDMDALPSRRWCGGIWQWFGAASGSGGQRGRPDALRGQTDSNAHAVKLLASMCVWEATKVGHDGGRKGADLRQNHSFPSHCVQTSAHLHGTRVGRRVAVSGRVAASGGERWNLALGWPRRGLGAAQLGRMGQMVGHG